MNNSPLCILLVEDERAHAHLVQGVLSDASPEPLTVRHVERLAEAIDRLADTNIDIVLLDLSLPDAQGLHGLSRVRAAAPRVPIVIMSANTDETLAVQAVHDGAQDYLIKGRIDGQALDRSLRYAIARQDAENRLTHLAFYDALTDLPNRALLHDRLRRGLTHAQQQQTSLALLFLDLDGFKAVNDTHGHDAGDLLLCAVARRLEACLRDTDTAARLAGDEFVVLLPDGNTATAYMVAERIIEAIEQPYQVNDNVVTVTASIGVSTYPEHGQTADHLMSATDEAMYRAKEHGKNAVMLATQSTALAAHQSNQDVRAEQSDQRRMVMRT